MTSTGVFSTAIYRRKSMEKASVFPFLASF